MSKHPKVNDPAGLVIVDRINNNFGFLNDDPPELVIGSNSVNLAEASITSNIYSIDPASNESMHTITGGVVGQQVTLVNISSTYSITVNGSGGNIKGLTGSAVLSGQYSNIVLNKIDTDNWGVVSSSGNIILENIFGTSYGNAKDGNAKASDYVVGPLFVMGGEYWFDQFEIDEDITVDASIGWLVIRANTVSVTKSGGALIDGEGKSKSQGSAGTVRSQNSIDGTQTSGSTSDTIPCIGCAAQGGSGGSGEAYGSGSLPRETGTTGTVRSNPMVASNSKLILGANGVSSSTGSVAGRNGMSADNLSTSEVSWLLQNPINYGSGGSGGSGGAAYESGPGDASNGTAGGAGGAGVGILAKALTLTNNLTINCNGVSSSNVTGGTDGQGGSGGGGGAGSSLVSYITKNGTGIITQTSTKGTSGTTGSGGGKGGDGGDGLKVIIDDFAKTISINGGAFLPA